MKSRFFTNHNGVFGCGTEYIEINPVDNVIFHMKDGSIEVNHNWSPYSILKNVELGNWKEIFTVKSALEKSKIKNPKVKAKPKAYFIFFDVGGKYDFRVDIDKPISIHIQSDQYNYKSDAVRAAKKLCKNMGLEYHDYETELN